jgi:hypothetical protein
LLDTYSYKASFAFNDFMQFPGAGAFHIKPVFVSAAPVGALAGAGLENVDLDHDFGCTSGTSDEEYVYTLPKKMKVLAKPDDFSLTTAHLSFKASYRLKGNQLTVTRSIVDKSPGNVCGPAIAAEYKAFSAKVMQNLRAQVVYK